MEVRQRSLAFVKIVALVISSLPVGLGDPVYSAASQASGMDLTASNYGTQLFQEELYKPLAYSQSAAAGYGGTPSLLDASLTTPDQLQLVTQHLRQAAENQRFYQQEASALSAQVELASERLVAQQRLASIQLSQARMAAQSVLTDLQNKQIGSRQPSISPDLQASSTGVRSHRPADEMLALPQTMSKISGNRHKNPALAALLLEPAFYGYSVIMWAIFLVCTGVSSAFCVYIGKLQVPRSNREELPLGTASRRQQPAEQPGRQGIAKQIFQYPGSCLKSGAKDRFIPDLKRSASLAASADSEDEAAETWVRVPARRSSQYQATGYLDESDCEDTYGRAGWN